MYEKLLRLADKYRDYSNELIEDIENKEVLKIILLQETQGFSDSLLQVIFDNKKNLAKLLNKDMVKRVIR